ncbi:30s ribosomal protein chloroplastic [Lasius niger]|uniref:30s ribosomal protein chloroplastic n=1 Tax=Lasius niger TaxID=67767 RepID=A0A0J7KER4_LASNI|nr:30s ribosomal protein chloroplastic [Lasius niger]
MLKSALRMTKFPVLTGSVSTDGRLTSLFAYLNITSRNICTTSLCSKEIRLQNEKVKVGKGSKYGLVEGETTMETLNINQQAHLFPDEDTPNRLFDGRPFKELHIINIKSTPNNTIMNFTEANGKVLLLHTAGIEGFKNAKKGTNIAGQQAAITLGNRIREYGINTVRIKVQGIGPVFYKRSSNGRVKHYINYGCY